MPIKTAAEMFGDDAGFGAAVPFSITNPAGTGTGNRGIAFGEQLTAEIANRPHYALALNDEDLNTRLAAFETGGLNGAYDGGTIGPAGSGRDITKDNGAVEVVMTHASTLGDTQNDPAGFRAVALTANTVAAHGFEFVGKRSASDALTGDDPVGGFVDRRAVAMSGTTNTVVAYNTPATLNPGGASPTVCRLTSGKFHTAGVTDLFSGNTNGILTGDLVVVTDCSVAAHNGVYCIFSFSGSNTDVVLRTLGGGTPTFGSGATCNVTVYRRQFRTSGLASSEFRGLPRTASALDVLGGSRTDWTNIAGGAVLDGGALAALRVRSVGNDGTPYTAAYFDSRGRLRGGQDLANYVNDFDKNSGLAAAYRSDLIADGSIGFLSSKDTDLDTAHSTAFGFMSLNQLRTDSFTPAVALAGVTMEFTANSPIDGEVLFDAAQDANVLTGFPTGSILRIGSDDAFAGDYMIGSKITSGNKGFHIVRLDDTVPDHFPTSGTFTAQFLSHSSLGTQVTLGSAMTNSDFADGVAYSAARPSVIGSAASNIGALYSPTAFLGLVQGDSLLSGGIGSSFFRGWKAANGIADLEMFNLRGDGTLFARTAVYVGSMTTRPTVLKNIPLSACVPEMDVTGLSMWRMQPVASGYQWSSLAAGAFIYIPLGSIVHGGDMIKRIRVIAEPASVNTTDADQMQIALVRQNPATGGLGTPTVIASALDDETADLQQIVMDTIDFTHNGQDIYLRIRASDTIGDTLHKIDLQVQPAALSNF